MIRFNTDGTLDTSFGNGGKVSTDINGMEDHGYAIALQPDNKIILAGHSYSAGADDSAIVVARYNNETLGVNDNLTTEFRLYPNPAEETLTIELKNNTGTSSLEIVDLLGKTVYTSQINQTENINVSQLSQGTYFVKIKAEGKSEVIRFVKK